MNDSPDDQNAWHIWIDTGGTFTDCLAQSPGDRRRGEFRRVKVLSTSALRGRIVRQINPSTLETAQNWNLHVDAISGFTFECVGTDLNGKRTVVRFEPQRSIIELDGDIDSWPGALFEVKSRWPAPILAARLVTQTPASASLPPIHMRLATTRGTNALLERRGAPVALFMTQGFKDLLVINDQQRPDLFALKVDRPPPLCEHVVEVYERLAADGSLLVSMDVDRLRHDAMKMRARGISIAAIAFMHSYKNPRHEQQAAELLRQAGFSHVSLSSEIAPLARLLPRASTAAVDAYLSPVIRDYLDAVQRADESSARHQERDKIQLHVMTSAGGLVRANAYRSCESLLSGPAGGIAGAAEAARRSGFKRIISFDMGGTSTDVARFDGDFEYRFEQRIANVRIFSPALAIETVAAGGGSICAVVDDRLIVGPHSAGSSPGPACYGVGGPLTLTDVNLLLGRLGQSQFEIPIDIEPASRMAEEVARMVARQSEQASIESILQGFLDIANERMAATIERISIRQGYDPREYALVAFGGAGGQHACAVARRLNINTIIMPADASLLSAKGLGFAAIERFAHKQVLQPFKACAPNLSNWIAQLSQQAMREVAAEGVAINDIFIRRIILNLRLLGQDTTLQIDATPSDDATSIAQRFVERFRAMYGHAPAEPGEPIFQRIELESIRLAASSVRRSEVPDSVNRTQSRQAASPITQRAWFQGQWHNVLFIDRDSLEPGVAVEGPALIVDRRSTLVIERDWRATMDQADAIVADYQGQAESKKLETAPHAVQLELFSNRFASIAEDMGQVLQRTALSTNVKERLDFSCGLLDAEGQLVVNAPHIPIHLGALGVCVRAVCQKRALSEGDVAITNHPAWGGSHLPDVTVITPVFVEGSQLIGYVASRAHHAEIGGARPGSMPPDATSLIQEGVVIEPQLIIERGESRMHEIELLLRSGPHPSRAVGDNLADLRAMIAANQRGAQAFKALASQHGFNVIQVQMAALADRAERLTRYALSRFPPGDYRATEKLDDGSPIIVCITIKDGRAIIDFDGSAGTHSGNLNATPGIVRSAVMYVLRLLVGEQVPLNEGIMRAVELHIPVGMLNPEFHAEAARCPAVVGGNTETSQRIVDTLIKALGIAACSQGTMNNVLFGNANFSYYETVCGGTGAGPTFDGTSAVHSHMTNTRITDPEVIEHRYPARVDEFSIRANSGGSGAFRGGDGAVRRMTFLQPMSLSILSQHRREAPFGLRGGEPGAVGRQIVRRVNGETIELQSIDGCEVQAGDQLVLHTPGGGGYGKPGEATSVPLPR